MKSGVIYIIGILALTSGLFSFIKYESVGGIVGGREVVHHVMEVDLRDPRAVIDHGYSFGMLYGFQTTSKIANEADAVAAINGMFYDDLGMPIGIVIDGGKPVRIHDAGTPVVMVGESGEVVIAEVDSQAIMYVGEGYVWLYSVNGRVPNGSWGYFEPVFGKTTRIQRPSTNYVINNGRITEIIYSESPVALSDCDGILTYAGEDDTFNLGEEVRLTFDLGFDELNIQTAFQAGGWLVKDGLNVAASLDPFIGYTTAAQPRTLVGVKESGELVFVVVDGRQKGYSLGVSGKEAAQLMLNQGCTEAAYLDGGASSTLWLDGQVVNKPSGKAERAVAHVILIRDLSKGE